jgi:hypothetical protein
MPSVEPNVKFPIESGRAAQDADIRGPFNLWHEFKNSIDSEWIIPLSECDRTRRLNRQRDLKFETPQKRKGHFDSNEKEGSENFSSYFSLFLRQAICMLRITFRNSETHSKTTGLPFNLV